MSLSLKDITNLTAEQKKAKETALIQASLMAYYEEKWRTKPAPTESLPARYTQDLRSKKVELNKSACEGEEILLAQATAAAAARRKRK